MPTRKNIINNIVPTSKFRKSVCLIIPVLIRWAKSGKTNMTYGDLRHATGIKNIQNIGRLLKRVHFVINELKGQSGVEIPTLNSLVKNKSTKLPSDGFEIVYPSYNKLNDDEKKVFVEGLDSKAINFKRWDWVLDQLGLEPAQITTDEELQSKTGKIGGSSGEGKDHKKLKKYILDHPESIGIKDVVSRSDEYTLPSGDRVDVYIIRKNGDRIAVEVKPESSPDEDMLRGIFQCVKYVSVMEAVRALGCGSFNVSTILVLGGSLSKQNKKIASELDVEYIENFKCK